MQACEVFFLIAFAIVVFAIVGFALIWSIHIFNSFNVVGKVGNIKFISIITSVIVLIELLFIVLLKDYQEVFWSLVVAYIFTMVFGWIYIGNMEFKILIEVDSPKKETFWFDTLGVVIETIGKCSVLFVVLVYFLKPSKSEKLQLPNDTIKICLSMLLLLIPDFEMAKTAINEYTQYGKGQGKISKKQKKEQYNGDEQVINSFEAIDDLDNLEKTINQKIKKLKKGLFNDIKKFINKFATLEDLDNLEKIIAKKRKELDH